MISDYLFRKFAEQHVFTIKEVSIGYYNFCSGFKECPNCKILSECQQFSTIVKPAITKIELMNLNLNTQNISFNSIYF